ECANRQAVRALADRPAAGGRRVLSRRQKRDAGFTLLEVIVALAVLSISLTLILRTLSGGFHHQRQAALLAQKAALAQSILARIGGDLPLTAEGQSGSS